MTAVLVTQKRKSEIDNKHNDNEVTNVNVT